MKIDEDTRKTIEARRTKDEPNLTEITRQTEKEMAS